MRQEYKLSKYNRIQKTKPKSGKLWCLGCDARLIGVTEKCPKCGTISGPKTRKKNEYKDVTLE